MENFDVIQVVRGKYTGEYGEVISVVAFEGEVTILVELFNGGYQTFDTTDVEVIN